MVDRDGLENRCTLTGTQGSNPCLSANDKKGCESIDAQPFVVRKGGMRTLGSLSRSAFAAQRSGERIPVFPPTTKRLQVKRRAAFCRKERRDENPGISFPSLQIPDFDGTVISSVEVF